MSIGWDGAYLAGAPPWDIGRAQPVVVAIDAAGGILDPILDAGCGTGENSLYLAERGHEVFGVDWSPVAIERAREKASERQLQARFAVADALDLGALGRTFGSILDCGLFHTFDDPGRERYVDGLARVLAPGGVLHLLCFSDREPPGWGPRRVSRAEIREAFGDGWRVEGIEPARFATRLQDRGALAWHATIERG
ncbi:MAG TPA: class I SAM-dependent methyltransferase [Candidatus Dormibacteraeota bacterium]|nr:class I SAM-dependent methyltransferase [Candidatus Dormibacteraeota bacterium]